MTVSQDATSGWYLPASAAEWAELLAGSGLSNPSNLWLMQEAAGPLADSIGASTAALVNTFGTLLYQQSITGWARKAITVSDGNIINFTKTAAGINLGTTSAMMLAFVERTATPGADRIVMGMGGAIYANILSAFINTANHVGIGTGTAPTTNGAIDHGLNTLVPVILQHDITNGVQRIITSSETITKAFTAMTNEAGQVFLGTLGGIGGGPVGVAYWCLFKGAAAEMTSSDISSLLDRLAHGVPVVVEPPAEVVLPTTLSALQNGSRQLDFVIAVDGYPHLFSNADESAVQAAWSETDWATKTVISGLVVELDNNQQLDPWNPFKGGGKCLARVQPGQTDATDTFGMDLARTDAGAETMLEQTATRTSSLYVGFADGFELTGEAHCGTECFSYGFIAGRGLHVPLGQQVGSNRGKYVAHGVKNSTTTYGALRFSEHHRVATQDNGVPFRPIVSERPRAWDGRRVSVWLHAKDPETGELNSKDDALCVFHGQLSEPRDDDPEGWITLLFEHTLDRIPKTTLLRDQWSARVDYGVQLKAGQKFKFQDFDGTTARDASDLVVVASGAGGSNQVDEGFYGHEEIASILNRWLGGETGAARIKGNYTLRSPEDVNGSPRSVWHVYMPGATTTQFWYKITWPIVGWATALGMPGAFTLFFNKCGAAHVNPSGSEVKPFDFVGSDSGGTLSIKLEAQVGIFQGQNATLPAGARWFLNHSPLAGDSTRQYGLFLLECETPMVFLATVEGGKLRYIRVLSTSFTGNASGYEELLFAKVPLGSGPPTVRQIFVHEGQMATVMKWLFYSTGTAGYNHPTYDVLPYGQGLNIPHDALGSMFEASCDLLPGANDVITVVLDKARTVSDIFRADLVIRNAHLVFREGVFRFVSWTAPSAAMATSVLDQTNKAEAIAVKAPQRSTAVLDSSWVKNYVKLNYNRDISKVVGGGEDVFLAMPFVIEDATSIDDRSGVASPVTLDLRNVYNDTDQAGQGVRQLAKGLTAWMHHWSQPLWKIRRSIAPTLFEGYGVGEVSLLSDPDIRNPQTGRRGIDDRPCLVVGHRYQMQTAPAPGKMKFQGEVDVVVLHADRVFAYAPAAELDETANTGGFTAGWNGNRTFQFKTHEHSESYETVDLGSFAVGDAVKLIRIDPDDSATVVSWSFTLTAVDTALSQATFNVAPSSPAFDVTKRYRMVYDGYPSVQSTQHLKSFQAGATKTIVETSAADVYGDNVAPINILGLPAQYDHTKVPELLANVSYGPNVGAGRDTGYDQELALLLDNMMDHQTGRSSPAVSRGESANLVNDGWQLLRVEELFLGDMIYGSGLNRYLWLAPHWRSVGAGTEASQLRVWISGYPPEGAGFVNLKNAAPGYVIKAPAAGNAWSVMPSDVDYRMDGAQAYPLGNFNGHQFVYIIVEGTLGASFRGLYQVTESERIEL